MFPLDKLRLDQRQLCDIQGRLFELARANGYDCPAFIEAFMNSDVARRMDSTFDFLQWAGEEYLLEELDAEAGGLPPAGAPWGREPMYWTGYIYRLWHYLTGAGTFMPLPMPTPWEALTWACTSSTHSLP